MYCVYLDTGTAAWHSCTSEVKSFFFCPERSRYPWEILILSQTLSPHKKCIYLDRSIAAAGREIKLSPPRKNNISFLLSDRSHLHFPRLPSFSLGQAAHPSPARGYLLPGAFPMSLKL